MILRDELIDLIWAANQIIFMAQVSQAAHA